MKRVALVIPDSWRAALALRKRRTGPLDNDQTAFPSKVRLESIGS